MATLPAPTARGLINEIGDVLWDLPTMVTSPLYRRWHLRWGANASRGRRIDAGGHTGP